MDLSNTFKVEPIKQKSFTGNLYSKDIKLAKIENNIIIEVYKYNMLPLHFRAISSDLVGLSIEDWIGSRTVDYSRANYRKMKQVLNSSARPYTLVIQHNAYCVTDSYWLKEEEDDITYLELRAANNDLSETAIKGKIKSSNSKIKITPEFCNTGSFEKGWRKSADSKWNLIKAGDGNMRSGCNLSESIACKIGESLEFKIASYEMLEGGDFVSTKDITDSGKCNLEPWGTLYLSSLFNDTTSYDFVYEKMKALGSGEDYLNMLYFDALIGNYDRHEFNFSLLTNSETGKIMGLSPLYDHNLALIGHIWSDEIGSDELDLTRKIGGFLSSENYKIKMVDLEGIKNIIKTEVEKLSDLNRMDIERKFTDFNKKNTLENYIYNYIVTRYDILKSYLK